MSAEEELRQAAKTLLRQPVLGTREMSAAIAEWIDVAGADEWAHGPHCLTPCDDCDDDLRAPHIRAALNVARLINGGAS